MMNLLEERFSVPFPVFGPRALSRFLVEVRRAEVVHVHDTFYMSSWAVSRIPDRFSG